MLELELSTITQFKTKLKCFNNFLRDSAMVTTVLAQFVFIYLVSGLLLMRSMCTEHKPMLVPNGKLSTKRYSSR